MRTIILTALFVSLMAGAYAQKPGSTMFNNSKYVMNDGRSIVLRDDGKVLYDGKFVFERIQDSNLTTENYIPFVITITNERGNKEKIHAALEMNETKVNGKIWFTVYEGPLGGMRQSFFKSESDQQARL